LITAIILNRAPIITRTPTPFERAYYDYQARIQRALHNPFPYEFYFKQGSVLESRFNIEERKRERGAFGRPFSLRSVAGGEEITTTLQDLGPVEGDGEIIMPRKHDADGTNDVKSLDRRGQRNLYLLLMDKEGGRETWRFPRGDVGRSELLHQVGWHNVLQSKAITLKLIRFITRPRTVTCSMNVVHIWTLGLSVGIQ
jgi:large subunit ribosomal protein L46